MLYRSPRGIVVDVMGPEDQIYALIEKAIATSNPDKLEEVMADLRAALKDHIQQARTSAASAWPSVSIRRKP
jgi:rRNA processing protein Gar1